MAVKKKPTKSDKQSPDDVLKRYEEIFENITCFMDAIDNSKTEIDTAREAVSLAKDKYDDAKTELKKLEDIQEGNRHALEGYLHPKNGQIMPLFDRMEPADEKVHGVNSDEWRKEPVAALKLSLLSIKALTDFDIVLVGQLQDLVLADSYDWWAKVPGLTLGSSAAIVDRLNEFINDRTSR